jgi:protein-tyrosine phosphatase
MKVTPYWINAQLAIVPRPRGGDWLDDEMTALREAGIDVVVSMLEEHEAAMLVLQEEGASAQRAGLTFVNFPITDRSIPSNRLLFDKFLESLEGHISKGKRVGVHCRASIGRSSVTAASLLIRSGVSIADVWVQIATARDCEVPDTEEQREWVERHARIRG